MNRTFNQPELYVKTTSSCYEDYKKLVNLGKTTWEKVFLILVGIKWTDYKDSEVIRMAGC